MGLFGDLFSSDKAEPQLTIESSTTEPEKQNRRGRGGGSENIDLKKQLQERQKAYDDYRNKILSGEFGNKFGDGKGQEALNELSRLDSLVKETQQKLEDEGRNARDLGMDDLGGLNADGSLKSGTTPATKGINALKKSGNLPPEDIDTIASNLEGAGASQKETSLSTDDGVTTNVPPQTGGTSIGKDILKGLSTLGKGEGASLRGMTGEPLVPRQETPAPTTTENNDLETTQDHHEVTENVNIQDQTLDFQHLGGSRTNFDNNFIGFILQQFFKKSLNVLASRATGINEEWTNLVIEPVANKAPELYRLLRDGLTSNYIRLDIHDKHQSLTSPTLPLIIIILYLYVVDRSSDFKINFNFLEGFFIKKVLKDYFNFNNELVDYGMDIISKIPNELATAYSKQKGNMENNITANEVIAITKLVQYINIEYAKRFKKNLANELFNFENKQSLYLYEMLETLGSSSTLFQISSAFNTINNLITEMVTNPYLLVQLIALIYDESENRNLASSDVLSRGKVDKYIYYYSDLKGGVKEDLKVSILKNIQLDMNERGKVKDMSLIKNSDKVALYNYKGRYYVTFKGTDKKDEKDIRSNFLNFGGKDLLNNPDYDERIKIGKRYLDLAIMKSRQENLEPPIMLGFSLGGVSAMYLSSLYPNIETDVYSAILSKSEMTEKIMEYLGNSNIHFNYGEKDPISSNMEYYKKKYPNLDINKYKNNKFFSPHDLGQFQ